MTLLTPRERELIAVGASIAANCGSCLVTHIEDARKAGATDSEIEAAVEIGEAVKAVPATQVRELAVRLLGRRQTLAVDSAVVSSGC